MNTKATRRTDTKKNPAVENKQIEKKWKQTTKKSELERRTRNVERYIGELEIRGETPTSRTRNQEIMRNGRL